MAIALKIGIFDQTVEKCTPIQYLHYVVKGLDLDIFFSCEHVIHILFYATTKNKHAWA